MTKVAVREARLKEIKAELLNSYRLKVRGRSIVHEEIVLLTG